MTTNSHPPSLQNTTRQAEEAHLAQTLAVVQANLESYGRQVNEMQADIDEMLEHYHDNDVEVYTILTNTITLHDHMKRALIRNEKAKNKPYFGRIDFHDENLDKEESLYIGRGGISRDSTHQEVIDWRAPVANAYYENGLGRCSYPSPEASSEGNPDNGSEDGAGNGEIFIDLKLKRTYEIENGKLLDFFDSEVIANDDLLTKYLAKNKQAVLSEIVATIQKEQNEIIRKSPYHNIIVQGVAGSGKTTVAMHRISFILYNYAERFRPEDFYIVGSNRILLNYITGVLPDLDVYGVRQMTMEQLFVRLLYEDWDEKKYRIKETSPGGRGSVKGGTRWFQDLKAFCDEIEWNAILRESIYLNPRQFVEGIRDGKSGVYDETVDQEVRPEDLILLVDGAAVERYILQNPKVSVQSKINMLNERLLNKVKEEFWGKGISYTEAERKAILKAYRGRYGGRVWKTSIYHLYRDFLRRQIAKGDQVDIPGTEFDVYDLAALAYLYKRIKETEVISEAHHVVIDEAQDYGMMAYRVLQFCIQACTYTIMGDVSQNIHFGFGLNDWEELRSLLLAPDGMSSFGVLKKSYRNTVEISEFATDILHHGQFSTYPVEPIIRHGSPVALQYVEDKEALLQETVKICKQWQEKGLETIAIVCRDAESAASTSKELGKYIPVMESDLEKAEFGAGILVLPVEYTKGLEFDAVLILDPTRKDYPSDDGHAKLLYVAATRALHELCVLYQGDLTGLIADPLPETGKMISGSGETSPDSGEISSGFREPLPESEKPFTETRETFSKSDGTSTKSGEMISKPGETSTKSEETPLKSEEIAPAIGTGMPNQEKTLPGNREVTPKGGTSQPGKNRTDRPQARPVARPKPTVVLPQKPSAPPSPAKDLYNLYAGKGFPSGSGAPQAKTVFQAGAADSQTQAVPGSEISNPSGSSRSPVGSRGTAGSSAASNSSTTPNGAAASQASTASHRSAAPNGRAASQASAAFHSSATHNGAAASQGFGDLPPTQLLRPLGHSKADWAIRWTMKQADGLYLQSRYGTLRLYPVGSAILRVTFAKGSRIAPGIHPGIAANRVEKYWMYKDTGSSIDLTTDEMLIQVNKSNGAIRYLTREKKLLLAENSRECRLIEDSSIKAPRTLLFLDWAKGEQLYGIGPANQALLPLRSTAKYLSDPSGGLPFLISDRGYGLVPATDQSVFCCDLAAYGSYLCLKNLAQADFYFIVGRTQETLWKAYNYLCGKP